MSNADKLTDRDLQGYLDAEMSPVQIAVMYRIKSAVVRAKIARMHERQRLAAVLTTRQAAFNAGVLSRPMPPPALAGDLRQPEAFHPAPDVWDWFLDNIVEEGGLLFNEDHGHLLNAHVGVLWSNVPYSKGGKTVAGLAEMPSCQGNVWAKARHDRQLCEWFGSVPDFLITLAATCSDASFCARVEHEAYHCGHKHDEWGSPKFRKDGSPSLFLRPHDAEEFVGVTRRYGVEASAAGVEALVRAGSQPPLITSAEIDGVCGTCGK